MILLVPAFCQHAPEILLAATADDLSFTRTDPELWAAVPEE